MNINKTSQTVIGLSIALSILSGCTQEKIKGHGILKKEDMNLDVKPGVDFFEYANGNWMKNTPIPADKSRYGAFDILGENANEAVHNLLEEAAKTENAPEESNLKKIQDFYATAMNVEKINEIGLKPLLPEFEKISAIKNATDLRNELIHLHKMGISALFSAGVDQDMKNTTVNRMYLSEDGLSLSDRDYYTADNETSANIRTEFVKHVANMFELIGDDTVLATKNAESIMRFETRMAEKFNTRLEDRNYPAMYNPKTVETLAKEYPNFDWATYFNKMGADIKEYVITSHPRYMKELNLMLKDEKITNIKLYLKWKILDQSASKLSTELEKEQFAFYGTILTGAKEQQPRWRRMSNATGSVLGEAVGQLYVEKYFPPEAKLRMDKLVANLKIALRGRIEKLKWMSEETRTQALAKLDAFGVKIGYPDKWEDYSKLEVSTDSYIQNTWRAARFEVAKNIAKLGQPVDTEKWGMTPQTVNAYYHPLLNEVVFPAAILQPPFFYMNGDDAVNYGAIGVVIGHEMTHGFDNSGRRFDKDGNMKDWWTKEDTEKFNDRTQKLVDQFNGFQAFDDLNVDGKLTLGENIADYGGLTISLEAYKTSLNGQQPEDIDGFNNMQRFFLSYSKVWRGSVRDKYLRKLIKEDVHSPGKYRVNGGLFNIPELYTAFNINKTDPLYRNEEQRAKIW
ncbi:M13 family metallopeptidase [Ancylomarina sp. 16SWW S1-10-2]|uniref:M13 family metallopeptidase n=1 Tax=Ancylomarina sp. 16SWW S1-10-2 TaxID=2499681 RepID=UPI0012AE8115|nr:M13 family metallopeptidase [Ancylomarina sp. 16SWW S1-10-2]MRT94231.1 M13 family peptidase [Ancylomarina sp. 16SWW S1-10-2]